MDSDPELSVISVPPSLSENPYQTLLYQQVRALGVRISESRPDWSFLRRLRGASKGTIAHFHWVFEPKLGLKRLLRLKVLQASLRSADSSGVPIVWTAHNLSPHEDSPFARQVQKLLLRHSRRIIVHSEAAKQELLSLGDFPAAVIPHGHYRAAYAKPPEKKVARQQLGIGDGQVFLALGQIRAYKGFDRIVRAFRTSRIDGTLIVAGRPASQDLANGLRELASGEPRIRLQLETVPEDQIPVLLAAADWVTLPFRKVTTSGSVILALSFDRPVIVPDLPVFRELCGEEAALYFSNDEDLNSVLLAAATCEAGEREPAARRVADRLDWEGIAQKTVDVYREALSENARS